jgi:hypothetical protein
LGAGKFLHDFPYLVQVNTGGVYRDSSEEDRENAPVEGVHYLVVQPPLVTLGFGHSTNTGMGLVAGSWVAAPIVASSACEPFVTVAFGYRYIGSAHEFYLSPRGNLAWHCLD